MSLYNLSCCRVLRLGAAERMLRASAHRLLQWGIAYVHGAFVVLVLVVAVAVQARLSMLISVPEDRLTAGSTARMS